jgi:uncharacterized protein (DUF1697 family)
MSTYVALLRGINVGGNNLIKMPVLKACFEAGGFQQVTTYIASGNVVFASTARGGNAAVTAAIEESLERRFKLPIKVVVRSLKQMRDVVKRAPKGFGILPAKFRYDAIFLKEPLTAAVAMKSVVLREGVDEAHAGAGVLYFSRLIARATQSQLSRIVGLPVYQSMTIRNWNTTTRLLALMEEVSAK